jgi:multicomponent Na+:H+ antiporter subunit G
VTATEWGAVVLIAGGAVFFLAAALGLLRFPDLLSRLHAVAKADTIGLALLVAGLSLTAGSWQMVIRITLIWVLVMAASATTCTLIARAARSAERPDVD